jgi:tetratricopeptide (TPR) repeat protein
MRSFQPAVPALLILAMVPATAQSPGGQADDLLRQGIDLSKHGAVRKALDCELQALALYQRQGDRRNQAVTLGYLGSAYDVIGESRLALKCYEAALTLFHDLGERVEEATILDTIGREYSGLGEKVRALKYFQRALTIQRALGNRDGEMAVLNDIGTVYRDQDDQAKAVDFYQQALQRELGKPGPRRPNWTDKASLSFVDVSGNAKSQSFGFSNEFTYNWTDATALTVNAGAVRVATDTTTYSATGNSPDSFTLARTETNLVTTEDYLFNARFSQDLAGDLLWFAGAGWERNIPAGIKNRTVENGGLGYWWRRTDTRKFRSDLGLGYTRTTPVAEAPGFQVDYATWNVVLNYEQKMGDASLLTSNLNWTDSIQNSANYLATWRSDLTTTLYKKLALKVGFALTYNNRPASTEVDIDQTGTSVVLGQTFVELRRLDSIFTTSLVISF